MASDIQTLGTEIEVFPLVPNFASGLDLSIDTGYSATILHPFSAIKLKEDYTNKRVIVKGEFICFTKEESYTLLDFIDQRKGRTGKFWLYTKINEFTLRSTSVENSPFITCEVNNYEAIYKDVDRVYLILTNGDVIVRRVTLVNVSGDDMIVSITGNMPDYEIAPSDVVELGRVLCCRLDQSTVELNCVTDHVYKTNLRFTELPNEYPAT